MMIIRQYQKWRYAMKYVIVYFRDSKYFECFFRLFYDVLLSSNNFFIIGATDKFF